MTKKYNIQLSELENLLDMLLPYKYDETVEADIDTLNTAIARLKNNFSCESEDTLLERIAVDLSCFRGYKNVYPHVIDFFSKGLFFKESVNPRYSSILLSDDDAVTLCKDFYKEQGSFFSNALDEFYQDIESHLMFFEPNNNSEGEIHFIESTGDSFVLVPDYKNFMKASILIHESEHVIDSTNNPKYYRNRLVREIGSIFMELIGCDHLAKVLKLDEDHLLRRFHLHSIIKNNSLYIPDKTSILKEVKKHIRLNENKILKIIENKCGFDQDYVNFLFSTNIVEDYYYQLSYMIAIELYEIYNIDKDRSLYILIDFITNGNDYNVFEMLEKHGIKVNSNLEKYEDDMCLKLGI